LECDVHLAERDLRDHEFRVEELTITNDFLRERISTAQAATKRSPEYLELDRKLRDVAACERDLQIECLYTSWVVSEKTADLNFLRLESDALTELGDAPDPLEQQCLALESDLSQQRAVLSFRERAEGEAREAYEARAGALGGAAGRPAPEGWVQERDAAQRERDELSRALAHAGAARADAGADDAGVRAALAAELELAAHQAAANLAAALATERALRAELESELARVRATAADVQHHHDDVIERSKQQYELAANRRRLHALQDALDAIPPRRKAPE
jgi:hypothetical protein